MTPRPWRLTRRQRVEMEAALAMLRRVGCGHEWDVATVHASAVVAGGAGTRAIRTSAVAFFREVRLLRARVAIALRAALRADEDARCDEAVRAYVEREPESCLCIGAVYGVDHMREWPPLDGDDERVPLALWEVVR